MFLDCVTSMKNDAGRSTELCYQGYKTGVLYIFFTLWSAKKRT
jgi:hypothetical protein